MTANFAKRGGRAAGRALLTALCLAGLALIAQGAFIPAKAWVAQILLDRAFAQSLTDHTLVKPWPWADTAPVARIAMPRLRVSRIVLSGGSGQAMAFGPTLLPAQVNVQIMAAHRDTHFTFLQEARTGDEIDVTAINGHTTRYRITGKQVVRWDRFAYPADPARPLLALTTCYPFGATTSGPLRLVVWAEAVA
jgi:sortase A